MMKKIVILLKMVVLVVVPLYLEYLFVGMSLVSVRYLPIIFKSLYMYVLPGTLIGGVYIVHYGAIIHELGHYLTANKYSKTNAQIAITLFPFKETKIGSITWKRNVFITKRNANVELENNFQVYTDEQIKEIAKAGYRYSAVGSVLYGIIHIPLLLYACSCAGIDGQVITAVAICILLLMEGYCCLKYITGKIKNAWNDHDAWEDPEGFKKYKKECK